jgi:hypothetical protein
MNGYLRALKDAAHDMRVQGLSVATQSAHRDYCLRTATWLDALALELQDVQASGYSLQAQHEFFNVFRTVGDDPASQEGDDDAVSR